MKPVTKPSVWVAGTVCQPGVRREAGSSLSQPSSRDQSRAVEFACEETAHPRQQSVLHKAPGCAGEGQALGALLKGAREPFSMVLKLGLPKLCLGKPTCFTLRPDQLGKWDCLVCFLSLGWASLPPSRASLSPSSPMTSPRRHPSELRRAPSCPSFNIILLQSGVALPISPARHKAALSPIQFSGPGVSISIDNRAIDLGSGGRVGSKCQPKGFWKGAPYPLKLQRVVAGSCLPLSRGLNCSLQCQKQPWAC